MLQACRAAMAVVVLLTGCERWQPTFVPDDDPSGGLTPTVTFPTLTDCQQYLHFRFGNSRRPGVMYCFKNCEKLSSQRPLEPDKLRLGVIDCRIADRQIVGQNF